MTRFATRLLRSARRVRRSGTPPAAMAVPPRRPRGGPPFNQVHCRAALDWLNVVRKGPRAPDEEILDLAALALRR